MNTAKKLLRSDIRHACGDGSYERGKIYFEKNHVLSLNTVSEGSLFVQLNAAVKGGGLNPYKINIRIIWRPDYSSAEIAGYCSCPIGYNCKHVAAVCLKYQHAHAAAAEARKFDSQEWLGSIDADGKKAPEHDEFIAYVLKPSHEDYCLTLEFFVTKEKKSGGLVKPRKTTLNNLRYNYAYTNFNKGPDGEIGRLLTVADSPAGQPLLAGSIGYLIITKLLQMAHVFWLDLESAPIRAGETRHMEWQWRHDPSGDYKLGIRIVPEAMLLLTDPPLYLDTQAAVVGGLAHAGITGKRLRKLLSAPPVPADQADEFSMCLVSEFSHLELPLPKALPITELNALRPVPKLILLGRLFNHCYEHFIALAFVYGEHTVNAFAFENHSILKTGQGLVKIRRDPAEEQKALAQITELGFVEAPEAGDEIKKKIFFSRDSASMSGVARWRRFLQNDRYRLMEQGWRIDSDESFLINFHTPSSWNAEISESGNDWFEMRFDIELDGRTLPLLPLIMPALEDYEPEHLPETLDIGIGVNDYISIPSAKLRPFLSVLLEIFNSHGLTADGALKLAHYNAAGVAQLEEHSYGLFSLKGGTQLAALGRRLQSFAGIADAALPAGLKAELRPYQKHGYNWLQFLRGYRFGGILADDMGLGKTIQTLAHLLCEKEQGRLSGPCLIIAPTSLMANWRREAERFAPALNVLILQGSERRQQFDKIESHDLILTTYPLLPRDEDVLRQHRYYYLILDEAQTVKNPLAKAAQLVRKLNAEHRLCLTGTPMENHLGELWTQFDFLMPGFLGNAGQFKRLYRTPIETAGDAERKARLVQRIKPFMLRRTKHEVATELPLKTEIIRAVPLYPKQAALYESIRLAMEKRVRDAIAEKGLARSHITILDALLKLRQTCCDPRILALAEARKIRESAKLDLLMELLPEQLEEGRRILVFSQFTRMLTLIEEKLKIRKIAYTKLTGQTRSREEAIERFKSGETHVFLISLKAGGVGLNLTEADTIIIYDPWWNPAVEAQAADRAYRIGQDKPVFVYKLVAENTVEEKMLAMQEKKRNLAESIYQSEGQPAALGLTADDLAVLFEPL